MNASQMLAQPRKAYCCCMPRWISTRPIREAPSPPCTQPNSSSPVAVSPRAGVCAGIAAGFAVHGNRRQLRQHGRPGTKLPERGQAIWRDTARMESIARAGYPVELPGFDYDNIDERARGLPRGHRPPRRGSTTRSRASPRRCHCDAAGAPVVWKESAKCPFIRWTGSCVGPNRCN